MREEEQAQARTLQQVLADEEGRFIRRFAAVGIGRWRHRRREHLDLRCRSVVVGT
jgi:hypothetical protein